MAQSPAQISVVIAAYNVENFIEIAVTSALEQGRAFHEVIVVNDASTDRTGKIIDRLADDHADLIVIHNAQNVGLGPVRNIGMQATTGDYICFLDGDDYFVPNTVKHLQGTLKSCPELAIFNHARLYDNGAVRPNVNTKLLKRATHHTTADRLFLFDNFNVAWNKVYRRDFIQRTGLEFPPGKYEDIGWNFLCLMQAEQIVTTPQVLVHYRQRNGSILRARNLTHFDIFDRWDELFATLETQPELMRLYGDALRVRRFKSLGTVLDNAYRLPSRAKPRFAARMRDVCGPVRKLPRGKISKAERILDLPGGPYLRPLLRSAPVIWGRAKARKILKWLKARRRMHKELLYRHVFLRLPVDPNLVVYQAYWGKKIACNPYALYAHLRQTRPDLSHAWVVAEGADLRDTEGHARHLKEHSLRYYYDMARAGVLINNANFPDVIAKRPGTVHLQTKHGTPLKYMGLDQLRIDPRAFSSSWAFAHRCARWDYVISSNDYSSQVWRRGFPYNYKVIETGYPRNDRLVTATETDRTKARAQLGLPADRKVVLYAPTFRPDYPTSAPPQPSKEEILRSILEGLGPDQILVTRDHYDLDPDSVSQKDPRLFDLSHVTSTTDVLLVTDVLITDYSSIMFDYAVCKRPIIILGHDLALYQATRGIYFDIRTTHPGVFCETLPDLTQTLVTCAYDTPQAQALLADFHALFCHLDTGTAAQQVCDIVFKPTVKG